MRWNPKDAWIFSEQPAHQPLISKEDFDRVQAMIGARAWRDKPHKPAPTHRVYLLRKRLRCGLCSRRLQGHWVHHQPYYRCSCPPEYQAATGLAHPRTVYLREADLLPHLDQWLTSLFDPDRLDDTLDALEQASNDHSTLRSGSDDHERLGGLVDPTEAHYDAAAVRTAVRATPSWAQGDQPYDLVRGAPHRSWSSPYTATWTPVELDRALERLARVRDPRREPPQR